MPTLRPYQVAGCDFLRERPIAFLCDEMGLGKTPQTVMSLRDDHAILISCPAGLLTVWAKHLREWRPDLKATVCRSVSEIRPPMFGEAVIVSHDALGWAKAATSGKARGRATGASLAAAADSMGRLRAGLASAGPRLTVVLDEAHRLKGATSQRAQAVGDLLRRCADAGATRRALTATPIPRDPMDFWCLIHRLGADRHPQAWRGRGFAGFSSWARARPVSRGRWDFAGPPLLPLDHPDVLGGILLRRLVRDHLPEIPAPTHSIRIVSLSGDAKSLADEIMKSACRAVGVDPRRMDALTVDAAAEDVDDGLLAAVGRMDRGKISSLAAELAAAKSGPVLAEVDRLVADAEPTIVYSEYRTTIDALAAKPRGYPVIVGGMTQAARDAAVAAFQEGDTLCLGFTAAGREGVTLTRASTMIVADAGWILDDLDQAIGRGNRYGREQFNAMPLEVIHFLGDHPLERLRVRCLRRRRVFKMAALGSSI